MSHPAHAHSAQAFLATFRYCLDRLELPLPVDGDLLPSFRQAFQDSHEWTLTQDGQKAIDACNVMVRVAKRVPLTEKWRNAAADRLLEMLWYGRAVNGPYLIVPQMTVDDHRLLAAYTILSTASDPAEEYWTYAAKVGLTFGLMVELAGRLERLPAVDGFVTLVWGEKKDHLPSHRKILRHVTPVDLHASCHPDKSIRRQETESLIGELIAKEVSAWRERPLKELLKAGFAGKTLNRSTVRLRVIDGYRESERKEVRLEPAPKPRDNDNNGESTSLAWERLEAPQFGLNRDLHIDLQRNREQLVRRFGPRCLPILKAVLKPGIRERLTVADLAKEARIPKRSVEETLARLRSDRAGLLQLLGAQKA